VKAQQPRVPLFCAARAGQSTHAHRPQAGPARAHIMLPPATSSGRADVSCWPRGSVADRMHEGPGAHTAR
jgi:hypothetical protein